MYRNLPSKFREGSQLRETAFLESLHFVSDGRVRLSNWTSVLSERRVKMPQRRKPRMPVINLHWWSDVLYLRASREIEQSHMRRQIRRYHHRGIPSEMCSHMLPVRTPCFSCGRVRHWPIIALLSWYYMPLLVKKVSREIVLPPG